jgi:hypothetical protein
MHRVFVHYIHTFSDFDELSHLRKKLLAGLLGQVSAVISEIF